MRLGVDPDNPDARQLKADALRAMAQTTRSGIQTRNFLLAHTLHLEGKLDWTKPPEVSFFGPPTVEAVLATPPGTYLKLLEAQVDPAIGVPVSKPSSMSDSVTSTKPGASMFVEA